MHDLRVEKTEVFYSIYVANILTQRNVPNFKISDSTIRNYLKEGKLGKLTYKDVLAMKHRNRNHEKKDNSDVGRSDDKTDFKLTL